ncbi:MAG: response regulator [Actinobacteria bacterium]|nr:response regulator [Actinomycetota bacterium]
MIKVLIADDQALVRAGFRAILESNDDIEVLGEAADGAEAVKLARQLHPDVLLLDVRMPRMDGIEAARHLMATTPAPRILMLTTFDLDEYVYESMRLGASGFLLKDTPREQLVAAVRMVSEGDSLLSPSITRRLVERFVSRPLPGDHRPDELEALTDREGEVLRWVARGLSNSEIADELYLSEATVKTHVARILSKLGLRDRVQAVVLAYESGLVEPGSSGPTR